MILLLMLIIVSGIAGFTTRPKLEDPHSNVRRGQITTFLPGASSSEIETTVTEPIEQALREARGIRSIESSSQQGISIVFVRLTDEVSEITAAWSRIHDKLIEVSDELPSEASIPTLVDERRWDSYTTVVALVDRAELPHPPSVLSRWAKELDSRLRFVSGTRFTELFGLPNEEVLVEVDEYAIAATRLTFSDIAIGIQARDSAVPDATSQTMRHRTPVRVSGDIDDLDDLRDVVVKATEDGKLIRLSEISAISRSQASPPEALALVDGCPAVVIGSRMDTDYIIDDWSESHMKELEAFESTLPDGITIEVLFSQVNYTDERSDNLFRSLGLGMLFVVIVVWQIMGWRAAIPICSALPLTLLLVFFLMILFGVSLHQTSIAGLILAIGMLVDNPIIVTDEIRRRLSGGVHALEAVKTSINHLTSPLVGSNLTTALAFTPLLLIPGTTGEYLGQLGWAVIACLAVSLLLSLTLVPVIAGWILREPIRAAELNGTATRYATVLNWLFQHRAITLLLSSLIPMIGFGVAGLLEEQFFPQAERDHFHFSIRLPVNSSIRDSEKLVKRASDVISAHESISDVALFIGTNAPMIHYSMIASDENRPEFAQGIATVKGKVEPHFIQILQQELDEELPEASCVVTLIEQGPPTVAPIEFRIYGPSVERLDALGEVARHVMMDTPGIVQTQANLNIGVPELSLEIRQHDATSVSLSDELVAQQLRSALDGVVVATIDEENEEIPIRIRLVDGDVASAERVLSLPLLTPEAGVIPLGSIADWRVNRQLFNIPRRNSSRCNSIKGYVVAGGLPIEVEQDFKARLSESDFELPQGYWTDFGGISQERDSAVGNLLAYAAIIAVLIVSVLVVTFRSFVQSAIIGCVAILSLGCGLFSIWCFGFPMGLMAIIGLLGMMGLAINDSIVVLSDAKISLAEGQRLYESVAASTKHVITTTATTAAGVTPLILAGGEFWPPMMVTVGGGVVGATFLALGFAPALFSLTSRGKQMTLKQWKRLVNVKDDEWIVLTGSTSGIGQVFLERLCQEGCNVITVSNEKEKLSADKERLEEEYGIRISSYFTDLSNSDSVAKLATELGEQNIIGLINNAGFGMKGDFLSHPISRYTDLVAVNAMAPVILQHAILPQLREKNRGLVLNVSSINAYLPIPNNQVYTATKAFMMSFSLAVEAESDDTDVTFQLLLPGTTRTPFHDKQGVIPPETSTMSPEEVADYSLSNLNQSICIPNSRDRVLARLFGGLIPKKMAIRWVRREAQRRLGLSSQ